MTKPSHCKYGTHHSLCHFLSQTCLKGMFLTYFCFYGTSVWWNRSWPSENTVALESNSELKWFWKAGVLLSIRNVKHGPCGEVGKYWERSIDRIFTSAFMKFCGLLGSVHTGGWHFLAPLWLGVNTGSVLVNAVWTERSLGCVEPRSSLCFPHSSGRVWECVSLAWEGE